MTDNEGFDGCIIRPTALKPATRHRNQFATPCIHLNQFTYLLGANGLEEKWLTVGAEDFVLRDQNLKKTAVVQSERNVAKAKVKMLFEEAGEFEAGKIMGEKM